MRADSKFTALLLVLYRTTAAAAALLSCSSLFRRGRLASHRLGAAPIVQPPLAIHCCIGHAVALLLRLALPVGLQHAAREPPVFAPNRAACRVWDGNRAMRVRLTRAAGGEDRGPYPAGVPQPTPPSLFPTHQLTPLPRPPPPPPLPPPPPAVPSRPLPFPLHGCCCCCCFPLRLPVAPFCSAAALAAAAAAAAASTRASRAVGWPAAS